MGPQNSGRQPFPVCNPIVRHELSAIPAYIFDGSDMNRIVGRGHVTKRRSALIVGGRRGG